MFWSASLTLPVIGSVPVTVERLDLTRLLSAPTLPTV